MNHITWDTIAASVKLARGVRTALNAGICGACLAVALVTTAQAEDAKPAAKKKPLTELAAPFDLDKDGELNATELKAFEDSKKANAEKRHKDELAKYDVNKDGKINKDERAKIMADKEIEKSKVDAEKAKVAAEKAKQKAEAKEKTAKDKAAGHTKPTPTSATNAPTKP